MFFYSATESPLTHFIDQLRFTMRTRAVSARLILRVALATTRLPLDASAIDCTLARAARSWEAGLKALMENSEFAQPGSPALRYFFSLSLMIRPLNTVIKNRFFA